jgi:AAHS family 4-hydroxybenzoate transporter-like MFS transporter
MIKVDLDSVIDSARLGRFQIGVILICALVAMVDGFDTQVIGLVAPAIAADWQVEAARFGPVFGAGLLGGMVGAFALGQAGDRWGRKPILIAAALVFTLGSLTTPFTRSIGELLLVRIVTGFGLGGALPIIISITSEFSPKRFRTNIVALMFCGFPFGSAIGGMIAARMIPAWGWESIFYFGGLLPLALLPFLILFVPESVRFLAARGKTAQVARVFSRMGCALEWDGTLIDTGRATAPSVASLFAEGRTSRTLLIWATLFLSLMLTVFLVSWMPLLVRRSGLPIESAVLAVTALNLGGIIGGFLIGWLCDRMATAMPIVMAYLLGAIAISLIGFTGQSAPFLLAAAFVAGLFTVGAQMCAIALSAQLYDTSLRSTGVGWAFGVGRIGAVVGPVAGGLLIGSGAPIPALFLIGGLVALAAAATVFTLRPAIFPAKAINGATNAFHAS